MRDMAAEKIRAETEILPRALAVNAEEEGSAAIPVPELSRIDPMPVRNLSLPQQIEDRGRVGASTVTASSRKVSR